MNDFPRSFGAYVLLGELGRGAMGVVYQARHLGLNRPTAIKVLHRRPETRGAELRRFLTEAEAAAVLDHPHIIPVYEAGEQDGQAFLSMKLLSGGTLAERIEGQAWPAAAAAAMIGKLARAVAHAHERGVLHRDIKPANVLLDEDGEPCLADFGLAKLRDAAGDLTSSQTILGTPATMAPEVASGGPKAATVAADIYSLGAVLYELLTGRAPFTGDSALAILEMVKSQPIVPPRGINPAVPQDLEIICLQCLRHKPAQRYVSAAQLADDCERFLRGDPIAARELTARERLLGWVRQHRVAAGLSAALLGSLLLGLGISLSQWHRAERHLRVAQAYSADLANNMARRQQQLAETPLANDQPEAGLLELARLVKLNPSNHLARLRLETALTQRPFAWPLLPPLRHEASLSQGRFDARDRWVLTLTQDGQAHLWDSRTGIRLKSFPHRVETGPLALAGDGDHLATCPDAHTVQVWSLPSGDRVQGWSNAPAPVTALRFRSSSLRLAIGDQNGRVTLRHIQSNAPPQEIETGEAVRVLAFDGRGSRLFTAGERECALWELGSGRKTPLLLGDREPVVWAEFSRTGDRLLAVAGPTIHVWNTGNGQLLRQLQAAGAIHFATFNQDGSWVASGNDTGRVLVQGVNPGDDFVKSLKHDAPVNTVRFDPTQRLLLSASSDGTARLWRAGQSGQAAHPLWHRMPVVEGRFSYDGNRILTVCADGTARLWAHPRDTEAPISWQAPGPIRVAAMTAGGTQMAAGLEDRVLIFSSGQPGPPQRQIEVPWGADRLVFNADGNLLALADSQGRVLVLDCESGKSRFGPLTDPAPIQALRFSGDSRLLGVATGNELHLWAVDAGARQPLAVCAHRGGATFAMTYDGQHTACLESEHAVRLFSGRGAGTKGPLLEHGGRVQHVQFSPDGRFLATGGVGCGTRLWDTDTGKPLTAPLGTGYEVSVLMFSLDSRKLLAGSRDGTARVWDTTRPDGEPKVLPHALPVKSAAFSPNGEWIATVSRANQVRFWHASGLPLSDPWLAARAVQAMFTPDGRRLVVETEEPGFAVWELPANPMSADLLIGMAELVTGREMQADGSHLDLPEAGFRARQQEFTRALGTNVIPPRLTRFHLSSPPVETSKPTRRPRTGPGQ